MSTEHHLSDGPSQPPTGVQRPAFDPTDPDLVASPFGTYSWFRDHEPVRRLDDGAFAVFRDEDVRMVLGDPATFEVLSFGDAATFSPLILATANGERHTVLRRAVSMHFRRGILDGLRPAIEQTTEAALAGLRRRGGGDVVVDLTVPVPLSVIVDMLGVPADRFEDFRRWSEALMDVIAITGLGMDRSRAPDAPAQVRELAAYMIDLVEQRRMEPPRDAEEADIIDHLLFRSDVELTGIEIASLASFFLVAGHETTANLLASTIHHLLVHPEEARRCRDDPARMPFLVEEMLRLESPLQRTARVAAVDAEIAGVAVPAGSRVLVYVGSANRDPRRHAAGDTLDVAAAADPHLAFGLGVHYCLGAPLARLEAEIVIGAWLRDMADARLDDTNAPRLRHRPEPRGLETLPIVLGGGAR